MSSQPDMLARLGESPELRRPEIDIRPSATILPLLPVDSHGHRLIDEASGGRLGPARGLLLGLVMGAALWAGIFRLAWEFFRH